MKNEVKNKNNNNGRNGSDEKNSKKNNIDTVKITINNNKMASIIKRKQHQMREYNTVPGQWIHQCCYISSTYKYVHRMYVDVKFNIIYMI